MLIILASLFAIHAHAVVTKNCPQTIKASYSIDKLYNSQPQDNWNDRGIEATVNELQNVKSISVEVELFNSAAAQCSYRGSTPTGEYVFAILAGSTRANAKKKAQLVVYTKNTVVYVGVTKVSTNGLSSNTISDLYYRGEYCSWGDCVPNYINIGETTLLGLE